MWPFKNKRKIAAELIATGHKGVGTVVSVRDTGVTINENPRVKLTFRIEPLDGATAFEADKTSTVSRVMIPRQGDCYPVWYDRQDHTKWMFSMIADDSGRETLREQFGDVANRFTGMGAPAQPA